MAMNNIACFQPMLGEVVEIKTNWNTYFARLQKSAFGGKEFRVLDRAKTVQVTTVTGWKFAHNLR